MPLADVADRWIGALADATDARALRALNGTTLLGERAMLGGFAIPGRVSAGGGCQLYDAADGVVALNLSRASDRELLPALFENDAVDDLPPLIAARPALELVARARLMGMAIAAEDEPPGRPAVETLAEAPPAPSPTRPPRVVDLSALWAGPLAGHLLGLAGAQVAKVESLTRPDAMRDGDTGLFPLLNADKASIVLDFKSTEGRAALERMIRSADIVIEAARPRALLHLGIDADRIVRETRGLTWVTITGHGAQGDAASWIGFGDDCAVAAGLSAALRRASGQTGFVGDAIGDPLTGIAAARTAWDGWTSGRGGRFGLSMRGIVTQAMAESDDLDADLALWAEAEGSPFPTVRRRAAGPLPVQGADTADWLARC